MVVMTNVGVQIPARPKIIGVAHAAFFTKDVDHTRRFFKEYLGYEEPFVVPDEKGGIAFAAVKINDRQYVEIYPECRPGSGRLCHFAVETDDAEAMRRYLLAMGCCVSGPTTVGGLGEMNFFVTDPNGTICKIVEYRPGSRIVEDFGNHLSDRRVSLRMSHIGFMVEDVDKAFDFYVGILGFREVWRGGPDPSKVSWIHLQVPEGEETIELMLYEAEPSQADAGHMNHLCLEVEDVGEADRLLAGRTCPDGCPEPVPIKLGVNRKRQLNLFSIDGTRVEIMDRRTIDGVSAPSSEGVPMRYRPSVGGS